MADGVILNRNAACTVDDIVNSTKLGSVNKQAIATLINGFSDLVQASTLLNCKLEKRTYTEIIHGINHPFMFHVKAPPITVDGTLAVWDDPGLEFTDANLILPINEGYYLLESNCGLSTVRKKYGRFNPDTGNIKIIYNGGIVYNDEETGQIIIPGWLRSLAIFQITTWWQKNQNPGIVNQAVNGVLTNFGEHNLLPSVKMGLIAHRFMQV